MFYTQVAWQEKPEKPDWNESSGRVQPCLLSMALIYSDSWPFGAYGTILHNDGMKI